MNSSVVLYGNENTLTGRVKANPLAESEETTVEIHNMTITDNLTIGIIGQDQKTIKQGKFNLKLVDCIVKGFTDKGLYLTNAGKVEIIRCTFDGCAPGKDHMVDFNLCSVQGSEILIQDCKFINISNTLSPIKVCQRGGEDDYAHDISSGLHIWDNEQSKYVDQEGQPAQIAKLTIKGCTFEANESSKADIIIGDLPNYDSPVDPKEGPRTSTGNFEYDIDNGGESKVWLRHISETEIINK